MECNSNILDILKIAELLFCVNALLKCHILEISKNLMMNPEKQMVNFEKKFSQFCHSEDMCGLGKSLHLSLLNFPPVCKMEIILEFTP